MKAAVKVLGNMLEPGKNKVIDMTAQSTNGQEGNSCPKFFWGGGVRKELIEISCFVYSTAQGFAVECQTFHNYRNMNTPKKTSPARLSSRIRYWRKQMP